MEHLSKTDKCSSWNLAFKRAVEIDEEGAKDFTDLVDHSKLRKKAKHSDKSENGTEEIAIASPNNEIEVEDTAGGYCQPLKLAKFVKDMEGRTKFGETANKLETEENNSEPESPLHEERDMVEVCGKQICRTWLKYSFLKLGSACDQQTCLRMHEIKCKPELLYKDYSFKGLPAKHRKRILEQLKS